MIVAVFIYLALTTPSPITTTHHHLQEKAEAAAAFKMELEGEFLMPPTEAVVGSDGPMPQSQAVQESISSTVAATVEGQRMPTGGQVDSNEG